MEAVGWQGPKLDKKRMLLEIMVEVLVMGGLETCLKHQESIKQKCTKQGVQF